MIKNMIQAEKDAVLQVADLMAAAAKTAPKGSGKDTIVAYILSDSDKDHLVEAMRSLGEKFGEEDFYNRDAANIDASACVVIIGAHSKPFGLSNCSMCGFKNCAEMVKAQTNCTFNITDLGIAVGSAVSVAADHRIDNRVMYSGGRGALEMNFLPEDVNVCYAIPLFTGSKSIFFDRGPGAVLF